MQSEYTELNYRLHSILVRMKSLMDVEGCEGTRPWIGQIDEQLRHVESRKFRVAVVGEFKRGKSSLINALLERDVLPADVLPTTATFNRVVFGETPRACLKMKDGTRIDIPIDELAEHVTKLSEASSANARQIEEAVVAFPSMFCKNDVELIDTPGLNDDDEMTRLTVSHLQDVDIAIIAVSATIPFNDTEADLTVRLLETSSVCKVLFAVTMMDRIDEEDRDRLLEHIRTRIRDKVLQKLRQEHDAGDPVFDKYDACIADPTVYGLSARDAARARALQDSKLFEQSGYLQFMRELPGILLTGQVSDMKRNARNVCGAILKSARAWLPGRMSALAALREAVSAEKRAVADGAYGFVINGEKKAWLERAEKLLSDLPLRAGEICAPIDGLRDRQSEGEREHTARLLEALPDVYRAAYDAVQRATGPELQRALDEISAKAADEMIRQSAARIDACPELRDDIARRWRSVALPPRIDDLPGRTGNAIAFHWSLSPISVKYPVGPEDALRYAVGAVRESLKKCAKDNRYRVRQIIDELNSGHMLQTQTFVMEVFRLCAQRDAQAARELSALSAIDAAQFDALERELQDL